MILRFALLFVLLSHFLPQADAQLAMGGWKTHFAYNAVLKIAVSNNKVFALSEGALFSVDKRNGGIEYYSKLAGLNGTTIGQIAYNEEYNSLVIAYENGNIDIMRSGGVDNVPDLYNKQISASKRINHLFFHKKNVYLSTDFGIVVLNISTNEIGDTYYIGPNASEVKVGSITIYNGLIYASTENTLYSADANSPLLVNYEYWNTHSALPGSGTISQIHTFQDRLLLVRGSKLYQYQNGSWSAVLPQLTIQSVSSNGQTLLGLEGTQTHVIGPNLELLNTIVGFGTVSAAYFDASSDLYWLAAGELGLASHGTQGNNYYKPNGPANNIPYRMTVSNKKLFVVSGGRWGVQEKREGGVMLYENGMWKSISATDIRAKTDKPVLDFMNVAVNPNDNKHYFVTSYGTGLYEFREDALHMHYHHNNSIINAVVPSNPDEYTRVDGAFYDNDGNMWLCDAGVDKPIKILLRNGKWVETGITINNNIFLVHTPVGIVMDNQYPNYKWIPYARQDPGMILYDDKGTVEDFSDDRAVFHSSFFDQDNTELRPTSIFCAVQDKDNNMWVGTDLGPIVLSNPKQAFTSNFTCTRVKIPRNDGTNDADFLLENEPINAIAIDGANRKWIGTEGSGVYLMSANGQETIHHFTTGNSPLLSNKILSLAINDLTGEVFIGTGAGLLSYQSDAADGGESFGKIYAYPNPVREDFDGLITITGLIANTIVKITDISGNVVCETRSNGSLAVWDGKNKFGKRVSTGVYLAVCLSEDGTERGITKILVIN